MESVGCCVMCCVVYGVVSDGYGVFGAVCCVVLGAGSVECVWHVVSCVVCYVV